MSAQNSQTIIEALEVFEETLSRALKLDNQSLLSETLRNLSEYVITDEGLKNISGISVRSDCLPLFLRLRSLFAKAESQVEKYMARQMLASGADLESYFFMSDYHELISQELILLEETLGSSAKWDGDLMFIGAGALPVSATLFANELERRVICVDADQEACQLASSLISGLSLRSKIEMICQDARDTSITGIAAIIVASVAKPKREILQHIAHCSTAPLVLVRSARAHAAPLYEVIADEFIETLGFQRLGATAVEGKALHQTIAIRHSSGRLS